MRFTKDQKRMVYQKLSKDEQFFVVSDENIREIENLSRKYLLDPEKENMLDSEVYNTMIGLQTVNEMTATLEKNLGLSQSKVLELVADLNSKIFKKLESIRAESHQLPPSQPQPKPQDNFIQKPISSAQTRKPFLTQRPDFKRQALPRSDHLIETAEGNRDNVIREAQIVKREAPSTMQENQFPPSNTEIGGVKEYKMTEGEPNILKEKLVPPNLPTGQSALEQKLAASDAQVMKKAYEPGNDPYREPLS